MYFNNAGWLLSAVYPSLVWRRKVRDKVLYLTFDDGPIPVVTEYVLEELASYGAKATFFCVGDNIKKHPEIFQKILQAGHNVGNHTFNHLKGWKTEDEVYFRNIEKCESIMRECLGEQRSKELQKNGRRLFRPPYGLIRKSQIKKLKGEYEIIMWDVLTGDFDQQRTPQKCLSTALKYTHPGSIVILHDSIKAEKNLRYVLPRFLDHFCSQGFRFETL